MSECNHKCHSGKGLNVWVEQCPICSCANPRFDPVNASRLREEFIVEMEAMGFDSFRELANSLNY